MPGKMGREAQRWPMHFPLVKTGIVERESRKIAKCKKDEDIVFVSNMIFAMHTVCTNKWRVAWKIMA